MKNVADVYPLTPMQQLMLIHARSNPDSDTLFSQFEYTIRGPLEQQVFRKAWETIVRRHPALQTIFLWKDLNKPLQVVRQETELAWLYEDWRGLPGAEVQNRLANYLDQDRATGFNLDRSPPIRFGLFHMEEDAHHLVWSSHHLILDRWCLSILAEELPAVYAGILQNQPVRLPPVRPFKDYISWLQKQDEEKARAFWQDELRGVDPGLPLDAVRSDGSIKENAGEILQQVVFPGELTEKVVQFAKKEHLTKSTLLQSAWGLLMCHYNDLNDSVIGVTVSGRPADLPGVENIIGTFINNLPVRAPFDRSEPVIAWLKRRQKSMSEMQKFDYVSQDTLQKWCDLPYDRPLFETLFVYQQASSPEQPLTDTVCMTGIASGAKSSFPITLTIEASDESITAWISCTDKDISSLAVEQVLQQLPQVLNWIVTHPEAELGDLTVFTEAERKEMLQRRQDRKGRAAASAGIRGLQGPIEPPRNSLEALIAGIWADLLKVEAVGIHQNFIDLGGSSLLAVKLLAAIEEQTGVSLPISVLLDSPSVSKLAEVVAQGDWQPRWEAMAKVNESNGQTGPPLFLVPPAATSAIHFAELAKHLESDTPVYSFTPIGLDTDREPQSRVADMAALYLREIRDVQPNGPYQIGGACFGNLVAYEMVQQLESQGEAAKLITIDPFYLTQWMPQKRGGLYYLRRTWHFFSSGVLLSEFTRRVKGLFRRRALEQEDRTKKILASHDIARRSYVVQTFTGKMFYLQSEENHRLGYHLRWSKLSQGSHESFVIPETNHGNLLSSKNLGRIAKAITEILQKQPEEQ